jgi:hypothetical protein
LGKKSPPFLTDRLVVDDVNVLLRDGGYGLRLEQAGDRLRLADVGITLASSATYADLYQVLVRLRRTRQRHDRVWLRQLTHLLEGIEPQGEYSATVCVRPVEQSPSWSGFVCALESDPLLRMCCAAWPDVGAPAESWTVEARGEGAPFPWHPRHPGGTIAVRLSALLCSEASLLRQVLCNRFPRRELELNYFVEHFVRPLVRAFRTALDNHGIGLYALTLSAVRWELSPELEATGRVVITDPAGVYEGTRADVACEGMRALAATLDALTDGFTAVAEHSGAEVPAAVNRVIEEELRYLRPESIAALSGEHPLRRFVHSVAAGQHASLTDVLQTVRDRAGQRRRSPKLPQPVVVIDLDLCGIVPMRRTLDAVRSVSGPRPGAPEGIGELARPESLPVLPSFEKSTWRTFVDCSGLGGKYPRVDWDELFNDFYGAVVRPWDKMRTDTVNKGLSRFVWDVQDAGGQVVFCTGRRERVRTYTEEALANAGLPDCVILYMPNDRTRPIAELKSENLRALGDIDVVAIFDDLLENRLALAKEFPGSLSVAVEIPGWATERTPDQPVPDGAAVIATFETDPQSQRGTGGPSLSHTHSLAQLNIGRLRPNRSSGRWAAYLTADESHSIVDAIVSDSDSAAERTGRAARTRFELDGSTEHEYAERTVRALHHVFTRKQFLKGSRANYSSEHMRGDVLPFVVRHKPIDVMLMAFPMKQYLNRLKASGPLPDIAELAAFARLRELHQAARVVYPPGLHFHILTDGQHFRRRPLALTTAYRQKLHEYVDLIGMDGRITIEEINEVARRILGPELPTARVELIARYRRLLYDALRGFDIADSPLRTLDRVDTFASGVDGPEGRLLPRFREILMSMVYSVPIQFPEGTDQLDWSRQVYADLYNLTDPTVHRRVRCGRVNVLRRAWHFTIRYLATLQVNEEFGYERLIPNRVRLTLKAVRPGACGFIFLGGSGLLPWHGTGVVDARGQLGVDFAVSLLDQGFVPVYSPLLGPRQPWLMAPARYTYPNSDGSGMRLDDGFARTTRLRRR